jgi:ABC-type multidrug transport system fused ATPase/permease subunit
LIEPWIYRSIIDDIAGIFITTCSREGGTVVERGFRSSNTWHQHRRMLRVPMVAFAGRRRESHAGSGLPRAAGRVIPCILLVTIRLVAEWFKRVGGNRAASLATGVERDFILRTFRHVIRLPLDFFTTRASGALARQIDQSDNVAPIFTAAAQDLWPDVFRLMIILIIMLVVNHELAFVAAITIVVYGFVTWRLTRTLDAESHNYYALWDEVSSRIQQAVAGIKTVQAHGAEARNHPIDDASRAAPIPTSNAIESAIASFMQDAVISVSNQRSSGGRPESPGIG